MFLFRTLTRRGHDPLKTILSATQTDPRTGQLPPMPARRTSDGWCVTATAVSVQLSLGIEFRTCTALTLHLLRWRWGFPAQLSLELQQQNRIESTAKSSKARMRFN